jgi:hypothetical protein
MSRLSKTVLTTIAVLCAGLAIAAALLAGNSGEPQPYRPMVINANREYPMDTLADVRAHADGLVLATVESEAEGVAWPNRRIMETREGLLGRRITVRIDRTLWWRTGVGRPPPTFVTAGGAWQYRQGVRSRFWSFFGEVGQQYLVVLVENTNPHDTNGYGWQHEAPLEAPIIDGRTPVEIESDKPWFTAVRGKTPDELEQLFARELG